eukprot:3730608-Amphidinium_carterae.4
MSEDDIARARSLKRDHPAPPQRCFTTRIQPRDQGDLIDLAGLLVVTNQEALYATTSRVDVAPVVCTVLAYSFLKERMSHLNWCSFQSPKHQHELHGKTACCHCGKNHDVVGCMFERCNNHWCEHHALRVDDACGIRGYWRPCHKINAS